MCSTLQEALKSAKVVEYPLVWSWQQAEALVCDYTQLLGAFGGTFLDDSGQPAFNQEGGVVALEFMRQTIVDGLSNPVSTQSLEEDVRRVFSAGEASLALNWTLHVRPGGRSGRKPDRGRRRGVPHPGRTRRASRA